MAVRSCKDATLPCEPAPMLTSALRPALLLILGLAGCAAPKPEVSQAPVMGWDHRPEAQEWTQSTMAAVAEKDDALAEQVPQDIATFCPAYPQADLTDRRAFWAGLLSATAKHESTWNPLASGGGGRWIGVMQIAPASAQNYGCDATSTAELKDGAANLECAVDILAVQVERDGLVAGGGNRGIGRDWAPFRSDSKRADIADWTSNQAYCQG